MKTHLSFLAAALLCTAASSPAALIFQTQNYSNVSASTSGTGLSLFWNKFNTGLGTLTGATMEFTGALTGSFDVSNGDSTPIDVYNSTGTFRLNFSSGVAAPSNITGTAVSPISTTPGTGASPGTTIPGSGSVIFSINGPVSLYNSGLVNYFGNASYFSSAGPATFSTILFRNFGVSVDGTTFNVNGSGAVMGGTINLTYEYTPAEVIPEPGTWAAAALLVGGAAYARWRKRRVA